MARTKQTVRKSSGGKPPDPRLGQGFKDMFGETSQNKRMERGEPSRASSDEVHELEFEDLNADPAGPDDDAASEDGDGLEPHEMQQIIVYNHQTQHTGPWCLEVDKIFYDHIGSSHFKFSAKAEEKALKTDFEKYKNMYPFGTTTTFCIPVEKIHEAPPIFVYRSINFQYVLDTYMNMIKNSQFVPQVADLLPFSQTASSPIVLETYAKKHKLNFADDVAVVSALILDPDVVFLAISIQVHCPPERWEGKEVIPLVCCSDETYAAFEKFVRRWKQGTIPDVHGNTGRPKCPRTGQETDRDYSQLSVNRFRPINGLVDEDMKLVWTVFETGKEWMAKPVSYKEEYDSWEELAQAYAIPDNWVEKMLKFLPEKGGKEAVMEEASSSDEEDANKKKKKSKKKTVEVLPSQIKTAIHRIYTAKHGHATPS
ncbi:hypothetical protein R1sor_013749 [Riccia sorocarpa]|uniref:Uncharacterized protein n=1 Tax=Riccia sorocarpa TaxID=122646 RepID=A0ABD3HB46_9MARC